MPFIYTPANISSLIDPSNATRIAGMLMDVGYKCSFNQTAIEPQYNAWFGGGLCGKSLLDIGVLLSQMRNKILHNTIHIGQDLSNPTENARAYRSYVPGMAKKSRSGDLTTFTVDVTLALDSEVDPVVTLSGNFTNLPSRLTATGTIDTTQCIQGRLETLFHELSHALLGTEDLSPKSASNINHDPNFKDNNVAYGTERAYRLARDYPMRAIRNAENWGIFIEAAYYGYTT